MRRSRLGWIMAVVLVCGGLGYLAGGRVLGALWPTRAGQAAQDLASLAVPVTTGDVVRTVSASGTVRAARQVSLGFAGGAKVQAVHVRPGDEVSEGQIVATQDNAQQELAYLKARNAYEAARIDAAPATVREREIDMEIARDELERTLLRAPFSGRVTTVGVEAGEAVEASDVVVEIIDPSAYYVEASVDELDVGAVRPGQPVRITLDAQPGLVHRGVVEEVGLTAASEQGVVSVPVSIRLQDPPPGILPGFTATAEIEVNAARGVLVVPVEAVVEAGRETLVTRLVDGHPQPVPVVTGVSDGVLVEIKEGLSEGDEIVWLNYQLWDEMRESAPERPGPTFRGGFGGPGLPRPVVRFGR